MIDGHSTRSLANLYRVFVGHESCHQKKAAGNQGRFRETNGSRLTARVGGKPAHPFNGSKIWATLPSSDHN